MLKVLIVSVGKLSGGVESYTIILGRLLESRGISVYYALRKGSWLCKNIESDKKLLLDMGKIHIFSSMKILENYVVSNKINIIHCNSNNGLFMCQNISETDFRKKIGVIHGDVIMDQAYKGRVIRWWYEKLETRLIKKKCSSCIAVSESVKQLLLKRGVNENKIWVIYTGINLISYDCLPDYFSDTLNICTIGNLLPVKNQIKLLEALNYLKIKHPEINFSCDIYGEGIERTSLEKYISDNNLNEIKLKGYDADARKRLNMYALYIHPSEYESFGIAILEAMNAGCCIIANATGGMLEIIAEGTGLLLDVADTDALAEKIYWCYKNRNKMRELGLAGKAFVEKNFSTANMLEHTYGLYETMLGRKL